MVTQEYLLDKYEYDPVAGGLISKSGQRKGLRVGHLTEYGYVRHTIAGKQYRMHHLVWLYVNGEWPQGFIDHLDGNRANNKIENLRIVDRRGNGQNMERHRGGALVGCYFFKRRNKWRAFAWVDGKQRHIGYFATEQEAHEAYLEYVKDKPTQKCPVRVFDKIFASVGDPRG